MFNKQIHPCSNEVFAEHLSLQNEFHILCQEFQYQNKEKNDKIKKLEDDLKKKEKEKNEKIKKLEDDLKKKEKEKNDKIKKLEDDLKAKTLTAKLLTNFS